MANFCTKLIIASLLFSSTLVAQNKLQYNLKIGDSISINQKAVQDIVQDMDGNKHEMNNTLECDFKFIVENTTDSSYIFTFKFERFKLKTTSNLYGDMLDVDTKSAVEPSDVQGKMFSGLTKSDLKLEMHKNGLVVSVSGTQDMIDSMISMAGITDDFTKQMMIEAMKKEFGSESLSRSIEQMTFIYPNAPVAIGDTWNNQYQGKLIADNVWTLEAVNDYFDISGKSAITMSTVDDNLTMTLTGNQKTKASTDKSSGFIQHMSVESKAEGTTVMAQMNNIEIPTTIITITTYNIK